MSNDMRNGCDLSQSRMNNRGQLGAKVKEVMDIFLPLYDGRSKHQFQYKSLYIYVRPIPIGCYGCPMVGISGHDDDTAMVFYFVEDITISQENKTDFVEFDKLCELGSHSYTYDS